MNKQIINKTRVKNHKNKKYKIPIKQAKVVKKFV